MKKEEFDLNAKLCTVYKEDKAAYLLIQPADDTSDMDKQAEYLKDSCDKGFIFVFFEVKNWNVELSPWRAEPVFGKEGFGEGAVDTLEFIQKILFPDISCRYGLNKNIPVVLGGYSLAALFCLWSAYQSDIFAAVSAVSPSVWFPKWTEYISGNKPRSKYIYLSLGDKEEKTRNKIMSTVGDRIKEQYESLNAYEDIKSVLEWNEGNHFKAADERTAKGFLWCMDKLNGGRKA